MHTSRAQHTPPKEPSKKAGLISIVDNLELRHSVRAPAEDAALTSLLELNIPLADSNGQFILINNEIDVDLKDIRVLPGDIEKVQEALSSALESRGLVAARDIRRQIIEIVRAPSDNAYDELGGMSHT